VAVPDTFARRRTAPPASKGPRPTPPSDEWEDLSEDEKKAVYGAYQAINDTPGVSPGLQLQPPETATTVRVQDGRTLPTDGPFVEIKELDRRLPALRGRRPRRRDRAGLPDSGGEHGRRDRGAPDRGVVAILEQVFRDQWGRILASLIRRPLRSPRSACRAREPRPTGRVAADDGAQPRHRPDPTRSHAGRQDPPTRAAPGRGGLDRHDGLSRRATRAHLLLPNRLAAVLAVVYLIFNEGYRPLAPAASWQPRRSASAARSPS